LKESLKDDFESLRHIVNNNPSVNFTQYFEWFEQVATSSKGFTIGKIKDKWWGNNSKLSSEQKRKSTNEAVASIIVGLDKLRKITEVPSKVQDADLLRELAFFAEANGQLDFAVSLLEKAAKLRPGGKFIIEALEEFTAKKQTN
jgi:hypothetical protein